tara:strand:+ start:162 stop:548 length:387 start_codon:yes stop_codon:yes gene_type:complete
MVKKSKFKYKVGQSVTFKFYDGSVHKGKIDSTGYRNEDVDYLDTQWSQPMYTCHVPDNSGRYSRGYMIYTVTENMIKGEMDSPITISPYKRQVNNPSLGVEVVDEVDNVEVTESLESAIQRQKNFLNR